MAVWLLLLLVASGQVANSFSNTTSPTGSESPGTLTSRAAEPTVSRATHGETGPTASEVPTEETPFANHTTPSGSSPPAPPGANATSNTTTAAPLANSTSREAEFTSPNSTAADPGEEDAAISQKPGLVAIICIFLAILLIGAAVILVKCYRGREPAFQKLDEVPMQGKVTEGSPFAHFPPK